MGFTGGIFSKKSFHLSMKTVVVVFERRLEVALVERYAANVIEYSIIVVSSIIISYRFVSLGSGES